MILEENQNNITKKIKYFPKINKKSKNNKKFIINKKTNLFNITNTIPNLNINIISNNTDNTFISLNKLTRLT